MTIIFNTTEDEKWYKKHPNDFIIVEKGGKSIAVKKGEDKTFKYPQIPLSAKGIAHLDPIRR